MGAIGRAELRFVVATAAGLCCGVDSSIVPLLKLENPNEKLPSSDESTKSSQSLNIDAGLSGHTDRLEV
jgi:hypothetical protein